MKARVFGLLALLFALVLVNVDLLVPEAAALPQQTDDQTEIWSQVAPFTGSTNNAGGTGNVGTGVSNKIVFAASTPYYLDFDVNVPVITSGSVQIGTASCSGDIVTVSSAGGVVFGSKVVSGTGQVLSETNTTNSGTGGGTFTYYVVGFTLNAGVTAELCSSGATPGNIWNAGYSSSPAGSFGKKCSESGFVGYVGEFRSAGQCGGAFDVGDLWAIAFLNQTRSSEAAVIANENNCCSLSNTANQDFPIDPDVSNTPAACAAGTQVASAGGISVNIPQNSGIFGLYASRVVFRITATATASERFYWQLGTDQRIDLVSQVGGTGMAWGNFTLSMTTGQTSDMLIDIINRTYTVSNNSWTISSSDWPGASSNLLVQNVPAYFGVVKATGATDNANFGECTSTTYTKYAGNVTVAGTTSTTASLNTPGGSANSYWGVYTYGQSVYSWQLNATNPNVAGSFYAIIRDEQAPCTSTGAIAQSYVSTTIGGQAIFGNSFASALNPNSPSCSIVQLHTQETVQYRLFYPAVSPINQSIGTTVPFLLTITPCAGKSASTCYAGDRMYAVNVTNEPASPHVAELAPPNTDSYSGTMFWYDDYTSDDHKGQIVIQYEACTYVGCPIGPFQDGSQQFNNTALPVGTTITITIPGIVPRFVVLTTDQSGLAVVTGQDISGKTLTIVFTGASVAGQTWTVQTVNLVTIVTLGTYVTSGTGTTTGNPGATVSLLGSPCITVPSYEAATANENAQQTAFFSVFQQTSTGDVQLRVGPAQLTGSGFTFPINYPTSKVSAASNVGNYLIVASDSSAKTLATFAFDIVTSGTCSVFIDPTDSLVQSEVASQLIPGTSTAVSTTAPDQTTTAQNFITLGTTWAFRTDFFVPNMWLVLIILSVLGVSATVLRRA